MPQTITFDGPAGLASLTLRVFPDGSLSQVTGSPFAVTGSGESYSAVISPSISGLHSVELYMGAVEIGGGWVDVVAPSGANPVVKTKPTRPSGAATANPLPGVRDEWRFWPHREAVTFRSLSIAGYSPSAVTDAKPCAITAKEAMASGGVYTMTDRVWLIPTTLLAAGVKPKPGDQIRQADNTDWTVLAVDPLSKFGHTYRLTCRNLVLVAGLTQAAKVLRPTMATNGVGQRNQAFAEAYSGLAVRIQESSHVVAESLQGGRMDQREYTMYVGTRLILVAGDVVECAGVRYDVVGSANWDRIDQLGEVRLARIGVAS